MQCARPSCRTHQARRETVMIAMADAALTYAKAGLAVFPCWTVLETETGYICACGKGGCDRQGKHPLGSIVPNGALQATTDFEKVRHWWMLKADANVALRLDGYMVVDVDPRHGGDKSLAALEAKHGPLP